MEKLKSQFKYYADFPTKGVNFVDVGSIMINGDTYRQIIDVFSDEIQKKFEFDKIVALESRGFLFACPIAYKLNKGLAMVRKKGKLPGDVASIESSKEYGSDILEIQKCAINKGERILIIDDILATGGTAKATIELIQNEGGIVSGLAFIGEIDGLPNYSFFEGYNVYTMQKF